MSRQGWKRRDTGAVLGLALSIYLIGYLLGFVTTVRAVGFVLATVGFIVYGLGWERGYHQGADDSREMVETIVDQAREAQERAQWN